MTAAACRLSHIIQAVERENSETLSIHAMLPIEADHLPLFLSHGPRQPIVTVV